MDEQSHSVHQFEKLFPALVKKLAESRPEGGDQVAWHQWAELNVNQEIQAIVGQEWALLKTFSSGSTCGHTLQIIYLMLTHEEMKILSPEEKNIMLWVGLLHDLAKRGKPVLKGRDPIHPFRGAIITLKVMARLDWWKPTSQAALSKMSELIYHAVVQEEKISGTEQIHDNSKLPAILTALKDVGLDKFPEADMIFRLVLLHQSFAVTTKYPTRAPIKDKEVARAWLPSEKHWRLLRVLMILDSIAYLIQSPKQSNEFNDEINESMERIMKWAHE